MVHVRLIFTLGREKVCEERGDNNEDEADDDAGARVGEKAVSDIKKLTARGAGEGKDSLTRLP